MSCLRPYHIYNKSTFLNVEASSAFLEVPCGKCPNCTDLKTLEYKVRAYYEWLDTIQDGRGFAYMETLTFNEQSLSNPLRQYYGIKSFRPEDIRLFFKKLRKRSAPFLDFRYFLSSEYGGLHHRPHYHVIFYIRPKDKHYILSREISRFRQFCVQSWTEPVLKDGKPLMTTNKRGYHKPVMRSLGFLDHKSSLLNRVIDRVDGMNYVAKYVVKEDDYVKVIEKKFEVISKDVLDAQTFEDLQKEKRHAMPFHRQSQGFGASALPLLESIKEKVLHDPTIVNLKISKNKIPLPLYYLRKLFYNVEPIVNVSTGEIELTDDGKPKYHWVPTELGRKFELLQKEKQIDRYVDKYYNSLQNFFIYLEDGKKKYKEVFKLLDSRSLRDFAIYKLVYQGHLHNNFAFRTPSIHWREFYNQSKVVGIEVNQAYSPIRHEKEQYREYLSRSCINDTINPIWKDFDQIDKIFAEYFKVRSEFIQNDRDYINQVKLKLKLLHNL